jgi:HEAT repeat protein
MRRHGDSVKGSCRVLGAARFLIVYVPLSPCFPFALFLFLTGCDSEPVYMGRSASAWRRDLKHKDSMARCHAVAAFAVIRPPVKAVIPDLIACLRDDSHYVRHEAALTLSTMGPDAKAAVPSLLELAKDRHPKVREAAVSALNKIDPEAAAKAEASSAASNGPGSVR